MPRARAHAVACDTAAGLTAGAACTIGGALSGSSRLIASASSAALRASAARSASTWALTAPLVIMCDTRHSTSGEVNEPEFTSPSAASALSTASSASTQPRRRPGPSSLLHEPSEMTLALTPCCRACHRSGLGASAMRHCSSSYTSSATMPATQRTEWRGV
eukprot:5580333-Prymnesium_polylepis.2